MTRAGRIALVLVLAATPVAAVQTRTWMPSPDELIRGESEGIGVSSEGALFLAPPLARLGAPLTDGDPAHAWAVTTDDRGNTYLGTGPEGRIVRVSPSGESRIFFRVEEPMVTALAWVSGKGLYAGTAPEGKIYRIDPSGNGAVWCETGERYVWALAPTAEGGLLAATGEQGVVLKISPGGRAEPFFDSDEAHVVALVPLPGGGVIAGGAGRGLVYETDGEGHARVLHDDDLPEVKALSVEPDGSILAALLASPIPEPRPPALRIRVSGGAEVGHRPEAVAEIDEDASTGTLEGIIEGLPAAGEREGQRLRGRLVRIRPDGRVDEVWRSTNEAPFALWTDGAGGSYFGVGEPARLYRIEDDDEISLLATLREAQITGLRGVGRSLLAVTSNPSAVYRVDSGAPESGTYLSPPFDAGGPARWGRLRWLVEGNGGRVEFYTRTGNSADPDGTWSAWSPTLVDAEGSPVVNPEGRFLQWRLRIAGAASAGRIRDPEVSYAPLNRPPRVRDVRTDPRRTATADDVSFRWSASDPDGDALSATLEVRSDGQERWSAVAHADLPARETPSGDPDLSWREGRVAWPTSSVPEGRYAVRVVVDDGAGNHPGEALEGHADLPHRVLVDRTPPRIESRRAGEALRVEVVDGLSPISRLEIVRDGTVEASVRPEDGVCDAANERFTIDPPAEAGAVLRAVDAAGNAAEAEVPAP